MRTAKRLLAGAIGMTILAAVAPGANATLAAVQENVRHVANVPGTTGGHVVVEGDRLYMGNYGTGLSVYDITNPANPRKLGQYLPGPSTTGGTDSGVRADAPPDAAVLDGRHIVTLGGTFRGPNRVQTEFLDFTNPASPQLLWRFTADADAESHNGDIVDSRGLFLPSAGDGTNMFRIYSLNNLLTTPPTAPESLFRGNLNTMWSRSPFRSGPAGVAPTHIHDLEVYTDFNLLLHPSEWQDQNGDGAADPTYGTKDIVLAATSQDYPIAASAGAAANSAVYVIDITDPRDALVRGKIRVRDGHRYLHEVQLLEGDQSVMFTADENFNDGCDGKVYAWRFSPDLRTATFLDDWSNGIGTPAGVCSPHVFSSAGNYVFMGSYNAGLQVIDFSDPANLKRAGQYIAEGANSWGALAAKGYVYVGDFGGRGLDVFEFIANPAAKAFLKAPNPTTRTTGGIAETGCRQGDPYGPTNGTDGLIVPIPASASDGKHTLRALGTSEAPYDLDIWFHTDGCASMGFAGGNDGRDAVETIPEGATMASIDLYTGPPQLVYAQIVP